jgi:NAD(P)H-flavin reductase
MAALLTTAVSAEGQARNPMVPLVATIDKVIDETDTGVVRNYLVTIDDPAQHEAITYVPGQCGMISVIGVGESMIALASTPTRKGPLEFAVKAAGRNTNALHEMRAGQKVGVRVAYGNGFDLEAMKGKDLIFVGGGIGMSGLRSLINYCQDRRDDFGRLMVVYGARSPGDLCFKEDLFENWPKAPGTDVHLTVDVGDDNWKGPVALIPPYLESLNPSPEGSQVIVCGPPVMIRFTLMSLAKLGFVDEQITMTLEMKMQCGIGKCGRCNIGSKYVCVDGPVFTLADLKRLPNEY